MMKRIIINSGLALNKFYENSILNHITKDVDIRQLALYGPIIVFLISLFGIIMAISHVMHYKFQYICELAQSPLKLIFFLMIIVYLVYEFGKSSIKIISSFITKGSLMSNLHYFHILKAHPSDRDPLIILGNDKKIDETFISTIFVDEPFYNNYFINAIYIDYSKDNLSYWELFNLKIFEIIDRKKKMIWYSLPFGLIIYVIGLELPFIMLVIGLVVPFVILVIIFLPKYFRFHFGFYKKSAANSEYDIFLNPEIGQLSIEKEKKLANSLCGYGILYFSEAIKRLFGDCKNISLSCQIEENGDVGDLPSTPSIKDPLGYGIFYFSKAIERLFGVSLSGDVGDLPSTSTIKNLIEAATKILILSLPNIDKSNHTDLGKVKKTELIITGVEYLKKIKNLEKNAYKPRLIGKRQGIRFPIKKIISVLSTEYRKNSDLLYLPDEWINDELHYVIVGGAEHQLVLSDILKYFKENDIFDNVDFLENSFRNQFGKNSILFISEYFVGVLLNGKLTKGLSETFLFMRYKLSEGKYIYLIYGLSAIASKVGFVYWLYKYNNKFNNITDNVLYHIDYQLKGELPHGELQYIDINQCYANLDWYHQDDHIRIYECQRDILIQPGNKKLAVYKVEADIIVKF